MPKLITLNNGKEVSGRFENEFRDPVILNPFSKISLLNGSIEIDQDYIKVTEDNKDFSVRYAVGLPEIDGELEEGEYNPQEFAVNILDSLCRTLVYKENIAADPVILMTPNGFQWETYIVKGNSDDRDNLEIYFDRTLRYEQSIEIASKTDNLTIVQSAVQIPHSTPAIYYQSFVKNNGSAEDWDCYAVGKRYFTKGCGIFKCRPTTIKSCFIALATEMPKDNTIRPQDMEYCILMDKLGGSGDIKYQVFFRDDTGELTHYVGDDMKSNKFVRMRLSGGSIFFEYESDVAGVYTLLQEVDSYDHRQNLFPVVAMYTPNFRLEQVSYFPDPDFYPEAPSRSLTDDDLMSGRTATKVTIDFKGNQRLWGFDTDTISADAIAGEWTSDNKLEEVHLPQNIKIELENIKLYSYSFNTKKRENILMSIPVPIYNGNTLIYERQTPIYIDVNNAYPINLNNIIVRLSTFDDELIEVVEDGANLTLLVE